MAANQPDGYYPRLNAAMLNSGSFNGMIVSFVGKFVPHFNSVSKTATFQCCDQKDIQMIFEETPDTTVMDGRPVEVVGLAQSSTAVMVSL
jgi:hypothetical protein